MSEETEDQLLGFVPNSDEVIAEIISAAQAHETLKKVFLNNFSFDGKTLEEWTKELFIPIPKNPDPDKMKELWILLAAKIQQAGHYHSIAGAIASGLQDGSKIKRSDVIAAITRSYEANNKRRPAKGIIEHLADSYMSNNTGAKAAAGIVKSFWRQRLDTLTEMRKTLEQLGISLNVQRKYDHMP